MAKTPTTRELAAAMKRLAASRTPEELRSMTREDYNASVQAVVNLIRWERSQRDVRPMNGEER